MERRGYCESPDASMAKGLVRGRSGIQAGVGAWCLPGLFRAAALLSGEGGVTPAAASRGPDNVSGSTRHTHFDTKPHPTPRSHPPSSCKKTPKGTSET